MKICTVCGSILQEENEKLEDCQYCGNKDLRTVTSMKISMGKFEGRYDVSEEERKFFRLMNGVDVVLNI